MTEIKMGWRSGLVAALTLLCLGFFAPVASGAEFKYALDPELSLTGDCSTSAADPKPDPDCPYPTPPDGPSGRFDEAIDIAVDDWGNQYVASRSGDGTEGRIDVFDPEGHFIIELEDPLGPNSIAVDGEGNLYVYEALIGVLGDPEPAIVRYPPATYNPAAGEIAYDPDDRTVIDENSNLSNGLAIDRGDPGDPGDDRLYIAEGGRIRIYSSAKTGNTLVDTITPAGLGSAKTIAVDAVRRLIYVSTCKSPDGLSKCVVWVLEADAPYAFVAEIDGSQTPAGKFFSGEGRISIAVDETNGHVFIGDLAARDDIFELDEDYDFASTFEIPGGATGKELQSDVAENPEDESAANYRYLYMPLSGSSGSAIAFEPPDVEKPKISVAAENIGEGEAELVALIHPGQRETTYTIEYVTEAQYEIDGFESATLAGSGSIPDLSSPQRVSALVSGLVAGESYRFLVTAENELGEAEPEEGSFTTFDDAPIDTLVCANQALRIGHSAALPDCRAWELVTPPGTRGPSGYGFQGPYFGALQASPDGNAMNFQLNAGPLAGTEAAGGFHGDPYLATRSATGWSTKHVGPTGTMASKPKPGSFSPDQGYSFWTAEGEGTALVVSEPVYYVRYPDGHSELVGRGSLGTDPRAQGKLITEGGTHIIFQTLNSPSLAQQLEPNAPEEGITAVYDRTPDEVTHVVSLLPGEVTPGKNEDASYVGASADGEGIAFKIGTTLYLRVGNEVTHQIGTGVTYAGISEGGERIFYLEGGDLKAFDTSSEEEIDFTGSEISTAIPVNVAPQGNRAYFVSETATGGANPNGEVAQPGEQNLYLSEEGAIAFVATVTERDVEGIEVGSNRSEGLGRYTDSLASSEPALASSRLTPDGQVFVFQSQANLDGYQPGEGAQIFRYEAGERLHCVSCPPTKTAATGGAAFQSLLSFTIGAPLSQYAFVPALRSDGERLFFESTEALVSTDTDGLRDVYEWEEAGVGSCNRAGGCVYLISSPGSAHPDYLFGHSASGDDVFVSTYDVLVGSGEETIRIYDARVGGGFAQAPVKACMYIDECRPPATPPPALPQPGLGPSGNFKPKKPRKCPPNKRRVKRKGKRICVKRHKSKRRAGKHKAAGKRDGPLRVLPKR